jgi:hypothetical protein
MIQPNFSNSKSDRKSKKCSKIYDQLFAGGIVSFFLLVNAWIYRPDKKYIKP